MCVQRKDTLKLDLHNTLTMCAPQLVYANTRIHLLSFAETAVALKGNARQGCQHLPSCTVLNSEFGTNYEEACFLQDDLEDDNCALLYLDPVPYTIVTQVGSGGTALSHISTRLGLLYLLHYTSSKKDEMQSFDPAGIDFVGWTSKLPSAAPLGFVDDLHAAFCSQLKIFGSH